MTIPAPDHPLDGSCSALYNNTLYSYTAQAFQSLALEGDAQWSQLPMGVPVQGGVCVKTTPKDESAAALYIIGGQANSSDYQGLQRFNFISEKWEIVKPQVPVTQNRLYHGAVYLNSSDSILVYAGTQDGSKQSSSQTFTIGASSPYTVLAFQSIAPPAISPMLMQWSDREALYIAGSTTNTKAMIFDPKTSWTDSNATLAEPIYNTSSVSAIVVTGDDASKTLYTFDMSISPNGVNRTILVGGDKKPVQKATPLLTRRDESTIAKALGKNLTVANWPAYNGSLAPASTRAQYSLAEDQNGLVVISGGNTNDVLCIFQARDNCWENATAILASKTVSTQGVESSSSSAGASPTSSAATLSATSTPAAAGNSQAPFPVKILGAVLGSILAVALIIIALLAFFRWRKKKRQYTDAGHQRRSSGIPDEKNAMDFADRGLPQMISTRQFPGHQQQDSQSSFSSIAILMGRVGHKRSDKNNGSDSSSQFNQKYKTAISKPMPQDNVFRNVGAPIAGPSRDEKAISTAEEKEAGATPRRSTRGARRGSTRRSSGWNRYWSGGSGLNILGFGSKRTTFGSDRSSDSHYSVDRLPSTAGMTQVSAMPAPLKINDRPELNRVISGSPTIAYQSSKFPAREMSGQIERSGSVSSMSSYAEDRHDAFSSGVPASVHEQNTWTPGERQDWALGRGQSSYSQSDYNNTLPGSSTNFSNFPAPPQNGKQRQPPPTSTDMSWLNLGGDSSRI